MHSQMFCQPLNWTGETGDREKEGGEGGDREAQRETLLKSVHAAITTKSKDSM